MSKVAKVAKKILDLLPLNGSKLSFGGLLAIIGMLGQILPGVNLLEIVQAILANPTKAGIIAVIVGAVHKILKAKFPEVEA